MQKQIKADEWKIVHRKSNKQYKRWGRLKKISGRGLNIGKITDQLRD